MPAARYWRAVGLQSVGGWALELSALHLYLGGARVDAAATLTSTFVPASGSLAALQDDDTATTAHWLDVSAPGFALVWDFGVGAVQDVAAVRLGAGATYAEWLETLTLQYSSDGVSWTTLGPIPAFSWPGVNTLQAVPSDGDPHISAVLMLLHCDGVDGSTTFTDSSRAPKTVTAYGNAKVSTAQSKWGGASLALDGSGSYISSPASIDYAFGTGDFCLEAWVRLAAYPTSEGILFSLRNPTAGAYSNLTKINSAGKVGWSDGIAWRESTSAIALHQWAHIAFSRAGGVFRIFIDGVKSYEGVHPVDISGARVMQFGAYDADTGVPVGGFLAGFADDLRITKGVARYTADFTPPAGPFPNSIVGATTTQPLLRTPSSERARIAASAPVPPHSTLSAPRLLTARNVEFAGTGTASATGTIYGSTAIKGAPNAPVRAKVSLLRARDLLLVQQTWSDPATGAYAFHGLDPFEKYTTLAEYPTGDYRAVAADQLTPDIEEARAP